MNPVHIDGFQQQDARTAVPMLSLWLLTNGLHWSKDVNENLRSTFFGLGFYSSFRHSGFYILHTSLHLGLPNALFIRGGQIFKFNADSLFIHQLLGILKGQDSSAILVVNLKFLFKGQKKMQ